MGICHCQRHEYGELITSRAVSRLSARLCALNARFADDFILQAMPAVSTSAR